MGKEVEKKPGFRRLVRNLRKQNEVQDTLRAVAYWFLPKGPGGQASRMLSCGHAGPVGASTCKRCAQKMLQAAISPDTEGE